MSEQTTAEQVPTDPQIAKIHEYPSVALGRLLLGRRLFLAWDYVDPEESPTVPGLVIEPRSLEIWAIDSEVMYDRALALLAMVSVEDGRETVPPAVLASLLQTAAATAMRLFPDLM